MAITLAFKVVSSSGLSVTAVFIDVQCATSFVNVFQYRQASSLTGKADVSANRQLDNRTC